MTISLVTDPLPSPGSHVQDEATLQWPLLALNSANLLSWSAQRMECDLLTGFICPTSIDRVIPVRLTGHHGSGITSYLGIVTGEAVMGANMFRDKFAGIRDIVGGRSSSYEKELRKARKKALKELEDSDDTLGANAVVGVNIDYEVLGEKNGMLMMDVRETV